MGFCQLNSKNDIPSSKRPGEASRADGRACAPERFSAQALNLAGYRAGTVGNPYETPELITIDQKEKGQNPFGLCPLT